jgi:hypothetical protein
MTRRLLILFTLLVLSLIPAILLYLLFGKLNSANVQWTGKQVVELGGPVAFFFITLWFLWHMYKHMNATDNPLESQLGPLGGTWEVEASSTESGRKARSGTGIALQDGELRISGGTFFDIAADGARGEAIGSWNVEMAVSDGRRLKYFYTLTDMLADHSTSRGLAELTLQDDSPIPTFYGNWQVIGKEIHAGVITMKKQK